MSAWAIVLLVATVAVLAHTIWMARRLRPCSDCGWECFRDDYRTRDGKLLCPDCVAGLPVEDQAVLLPVPPTGEEQR